MKALIILAIVAVASANPIEIESDGTHHVKLEKVKDISVYDGTWFDGENGFESFIINGTDAQLGQYPSLARVSIRRSGGGSTCSGSFIHENYALTASHCLTPDATINSIGLLVGIVDRTQTGITLEVQEFWWHPQEVTTLGHDIGLMRTFNNLPAGNPNVGTIRIPSRAQTNWLYLGTVRSVGWGRDNTGSSAMWLQYADFQSIPLSMCAARFIEPIEICFIDPELWRWIQPGDSGSPIIIVENGQPLQIGIVAGTRTSGGVLNNSAARISAFLPWLEERGVRIREI